MKPAWGRFLSKDQGCRVGTAGEKKKTRTDHFESRQVAIGKWAREEQDQNRDLSAHDLFDEYRVRLEEEAYELSLKEGPKSKDEQKWQGLLVKRIEAFKSWECQSHI